ncbi:NAD-dependent epimerase/dehydratase family protein [Streptococcus intermedius]|jgi:nucleotide sugar dehydratase, putative|uniref:NAD-dependent epimerase/dehydratase family protein n=1 Tax=Streptococcus intermedius TaxID=1338 RepID=UPI000E3BF4AB|nr:NAD-dependent epimerase/dehydratase family protein [Streptococcus intermedius]RSJ12071.1 dTDP-glucose 4,6-dehydratase [Streptococcus intermedius]
MKYNKILQEDVQDLAKNGPILKELKNVTILVTGATGLIGGQCVFTLLELNHLFDANIEVVALVRNLSKAEKIFHSFLEDEHLQLIEGDVLAPVEIESNIDYIIHGASSTDSVFFVQHPVDTIAVAVKGTENLLELARKNRVRSMIYLSSLEVYGITNPNVDSISENDYGYLDPISVRSSYSEGKRIAECLCIAYLQQYQVPVRIARLSQTFGPGVDYKDKRVFAQFARSVIEGQDIILKTRGETVRNYCYTKDVVKALFYIMLEGQVGQAYNVANKDTAISIREMAELVLKRNGNSCSHLIFDIAEDIEKLGYNPTVKIRLNTEKLEKLGWTAEVNLETMFDKLIQSMKIDRE